MRGFYPESLPRRPASFVPAEAGLRAGQPGRAGEATRHWHSDVPAKSRRFDQATCSGFMYP